jgi:hypothetical protein
MRGDPDREEKTWLDELAEADRMRSGYQELAPRPHDPRRIGERLAQLDETRTIALKKLEVLNNRREMVETLEQDRDTLFLGVLRGVGTRGLGHSQCRGASPSLQDALLEGSDEL